MTEFGSGHARNGKEVQQRSTVVRWMRRAAARVIGAIIIGLVSPHLPQIGPIDPHGGQHDPSFGVCIVDDRT
jgi:hypothetical protein